MSNNQHNDHDPHQDLSAHIDELSTSPTQDSPVSNRTGTPRAPATVWDTPIHQSINPEPPLLENLGPIIEVDERYLPPNPSDSYFMPDSPDSHTTNWSTRSTLMQQNSTDVQMRIPDGRMVWLSLRALGNHVRTGMPIMAPTAPEDQDSANSIPWENRTFIPQTPTHTPAVTSPDNGITQFLDDAIPDFDLNILNEDLNRIDKGRPEDFYIVPSDYDVPGDFFALAHGRRLRYAEYSLEDMIGINYTPARPREQYRMALPNPRNLPTFQFIMTVPYELGREPVQMRVDLAPQDSISTETNARILTFQVREAAEIDYQADTRTRTQSPALDQSLRATRYVQQLPRLDQVDVPELQNQSCYICQELYIFDSKTTDQGGIIEHPVRLPCDHIFGNHCLQTWVCGPQRPGIDGITCPLCRRDVPVYQADIQFELPEGVRREPEGISRDEYNEASSVQRDHDLRRFGPQQSSEVSRDAELAAELMLPEELARIQDGEGRQALFEEIQLRGAFRPPHITKEYIAYGEVRDEMVYELLKDRRAHWTTRWGESSRILSLTVM